MLSSPTTPSTTSVLSCPFESADPIVSSPMTLSTTSVSLCPSASGETIVPDGTLIHKPTDSSAEKEELEMVSIVPAGMLVLPSAEICAGALVLATEIVASNDAADALPTPARLATSANARLVPAIHRVYLLINICLSPFTFVGCLFASGFRRSLS